MQIYMHACIHTYIHTHTSLTMYKNMPMLNYNFHILTNYMLFMSGSHQNVITTKLVDGIALSHKHIKLLPLNDFPNGSI